MFKKLGSALLLFLGIVLGTTFLLTIFNYFDIIRADWIKVMKFLIPVIAIFIVGYKLGKQSEKKGYLEGVKIGGLVAGLFLVFVVLVDKFMWKSLLYYLIIILIAVIGSMLGINRKKDS